MDHSTKIHGVSTVATSGVKKQKPIKTKSKSRSRLKNQKKYLCNFCQKKRSSQKHLDRHINTVHKIRDFICDYEGKHFNTKDKLRLHIFNHRKHYRIKCTVCNKEYRTNQSVTFNE